MSAVATLRYSSGPPRGEPAADTRAVADAKPEPARKAQPAVILRLGQSRRPLLQGYANQVRHAMGSALSAHRHRQQMATKQAEMLHGVLLDQALGAVSTTPSPPAADANEREASDAERQILEQDVAMIASSLDLLTTDDAVPDRRTEVALEIQTDFSGHAATLTRSTVAASILQATESLRTGELIGPGPPVELTAYSTRRSE